MKEFDFEQFCSLSKDAQLRYLQEKEITRREIEKEKVIQEAIIEKEKVIQEAIIEKEKVIQEAITKRDIEKEMIQQLGRYHSK
jgi:hypothetical protein